MRAAEILRARNRELSELETLDTGKPLQETLVADAASGADCLEYFGRARRRASAATHIDLGGPFAYTRREPLGVCVGIGAWNYPIQIACWKAAPALACGNAMIFKPSEVTPLSALKLAEILVEAGLPAGVFNVVQGRGDVGAALAEPSRRRQGLGDRLGRRPARKVMRRRPPGPKPVTLELGGKSPILVFADADLDAAVARRDARQFLLRRPDLLQRHARLRRALRRARPSSRSWSRGPSASCSATRWTRRRRWGRWSRGRSTTACCPISKSARREGATLAIGGGAARVAGFADGLFVEPTVFTDVTDGMTIAREEIFGPVMSVLDFDAEDEAVGRANASEIRPRRRRLHPRHRRAATASRPRSRPAPSGSTPTT